MVGGTCLFFFGRVVEQYFQLAFGGTLGIVLYVVLYVTAIVVSTIWDLVKYKDDWNYSAVGASGAVSAILFASILFEPKMGIYIYLIPIPVPGYIFAPLYLLYCWYMAFEDVAFAAFFLGELAQIDPLAVFQNQMEITYEDIPESR